MGWRIRSGCTRVFAEICRTVLSARSASFASRALKAAVNVRRFAMLTPFNLGEAHLHSLSEIPRPPLMLETVLGAVAELQVRQQSRPSVRSSAIITKPMGLHAPTGADSRRWLALQLSRRHRRAAEPASRRPRVLAGQVPGTRHVVQGGADQAAVTRILVGVCLHVEPCVLERPQVFGGVPFAESLGHVCLNSPASRLARSKSCCWLPLSLSHNTTTASPSRGQVETVAGPVVQVHLE